MIKKPAKKLFRVLCGFLARPKKGLFAARLRFFNILFSARKQGKSLIFKSSLRTPETIGFNGFKKPGVNGLPLSAHAQRFQFEHIKSLNQRIMTTYRLPSAIEHALPNWPLVDFMKNSTEFPL